MIIDNSVTRRIPKRLMEFITITLMGLMIAFLICPKCFFGEWRADSNNWKMIVVSLAFTYGLGYSISFLLPILSKSKFQQSRPVSKFIINLIILAGFTFLASVSIFYFTIKLLYTNSDEFLTWAFVADNAKTAMWIAIGFSMFFSSIEFLKNYKKEAVRAEKLEKENIKAQYESLKSQVNPHFLFNSLNALTSLIYDNQELAVKYVRQLSDVYRYVLDSQNKDLVPLQEELEFVESYLFLQKIRFGDNLKVEITLPEKQDILVAPLTLQVLLENAVKHNEISAEFPLTIKLYEEGDRLIVENPVRIKNILDKGMGVGLKNISERYLLFTDKKMEIDQTNGCFKVKVPKLLNE